MYWAYAPFQITHCTMERIWEFGMHKLIHISIYIFCFNWQAHLVYWLRILLSLEPLNPLVLPIPTPFFAYLVFNLFLVKFIYYNKLIQLRYLLSYLYTRWKPETIHIFYLFTTGTCYSTPSFFNMHTLNLSTFPNA